MADVIQLLPDAIANQIAAGEVIQRPASVVKELLENAVDAGSSEVRLIVKDSGKALIQVVDNGCGMSETDARMSFERHATSKIRAARDLFSIRTMGFRGEALASIASVAQVEMRTRRQPDELGTRLIVEGSRVKTQEPCQCAAGTNFAVKNLFFNIPARRNFLKTNTVEMRHIVDEFQRVAIANPTIFFSLQHNSTEVYHLPASNLRQRIVNLLGSGSNKKLVPVTEETDLVKMRGFVGKPEYAKKTRGEQFFFVNNRFIKSGYLNHAITGAYEALLAKDTYPLYVLFIDIDPANIDINVHPTKQEIKFDDEKMVYNYLKVAVRHALGQYSVAPTLDFEQDPVFLNRHTTPPPNVDSPFLHKKNYTTVSSSMSMEQSRQQSNLENWEKLYDGLDVFDSKPVEADSAEVPNAAESSAPVAAPKTITFESKLANAPILDDDDQSFSKKQKRPYQVHAKYIINQVKSGFWMIDQQSAHERILFEQYVRLLQNRAASTQQKLFPQTIEFSPSDAILLESILSDVQILGFDIEAFGGSSFIIHGVPADLAGKEEEHTILEELLEQFKGNLELKLNARENLARSLAASAAIKRGRSLNVEQMEVLIDQLFACEIPHISPSGRKCFISFNLDDLERQFIH